LISNYANICYEVSGQYYCLQGGKPIKVSNPEDYICSIKPLNSLGEYLIGLNPGLGLNEVKLWVGLGLVVYNLKAFTTTQTDDRIHDHID
jgi:hypothetical protein